MALRIRISGALVTVNRGSVKIAGVVRQLRSVKMMVGGTLRTVATFTPPLTASASPPYAEGAETDFKPKQVQSNPVTCATVGGAAPFTYAWTIIAGDTSISIGGATSATAIFFKALYNSLTTATARCIVTDAYGTTASCTVEVNLQHEAF